MTIKSLPAPDPENGGETRGSQRKRATGRQRTEAPLPDIDRILHMLLQLNSAVVLGVISTEQANVLHRNLRTMLDVLSRRDGRSGGGANPEALVEVCRGAPQLVERARAIPVRRTVGLADRTGDGRPR